MTILTVVALCHSSLPEEGLNICRLATASIYFWAGLLKLNATFVHKVFPYLISMVLIKVPPERYQRWLTFWGHPTDIDSDTQKQLGESHIRRMALAIPLIEAGFGLGLLFPQTRPLATLMAVGMHCFILFWLTKVGHDKAPTIGPWNLTMMLGTVALFWGCESQSWDILIGNHCLTHMLVLLLFTLMPALGLFNKIDPNLSHGHWSGRHVSGFLGISQKVYDRLPKATQQLCKIASPTTYFLDIGEWFTHELGVPAVQQERLLLTIARDFKRYGAGPKDITLTISRMPATRSKELNTAFYNGNDIFGNECA